MPNPTPEPILIVFVLELALEGVAGAVAEEVWGNIFEFVFEIMPEAIEVDKVKLELAIMLDAIKIDDLDEIDEVKLDEL